ncbi:MAG: hypothetical protein OEQ53_00690 [Saprospiraceae bacterium]|nr:hypothetical protein [Saprospiraceae bacterium]
MKDRIYASKVLLFGEYTVMDGGSALSIPYSHFYGQWLQDLFERTNEWGPFLNYVSKKRSKLCTPVDLNFFRSKLEQGWNFSLNIPVGKGLGSSGAICAAFLDTFLQKPSVSIELQRDLAIIESFYHGKSSGLDALVSLINEPIRSDRGEIAVVNMPGKIKDCIYLLDSNVSRSTRAYVDQFQEKQKSLRSSSFADALAGLSSLAIEHFLAGNSVWQIVQEISSLQLEHMDYLIPISIRPLWNLGLRGSKFRLKLCGAGGGGFMLVFAEVPLATRSLEGFRLTRLF